MSIERDIIDLDALAPSEVYVKFDGEEIKVNPPSAVNVMKLSVLGRKIHLIDQMPDAEATKLVQDMTDVVCLVIPQLAGRQLHSAQLNKLTNFIVEIGLPQDTPELKKRGITRPGKAGNSPKA